eukprot:scaffold3286_cov129-Isochrysis_galbana.AAC.4
MNSPPPPPAPMRTTATQRPTQRAAAHATRARKSRLQRHNTPRRRALPAPPCPRQASRPTVCSW